MWEFWRFFCRSCKKSLKVKVLGRPTAGVNDYSNLAVMEWADTFALYYPTSRLSIIDKGEGMSGIGIQPHIHIRGLGTYTRRCRFKISIATTSKRRMVKIKGRCDSHLPFILYQFSG